MNNFLGRQKQAFDLDAFEDAELDTASRIMQMFKKKNNRILKIFNTSDDSEPEAPDNRSYGLRLISRNKDTLETSSKPNDDVIDLLEQPSQKQKAATIRASLQIRKLTPVDIVVLTPEEINDPNLQSRSNFKLAAGPGASKISTNSSLRRTLFKPTSDSPLRNFNFVSSTPMSKNRNEAFSSINQMDRFSPIAQGAGNTPDKSKSSSTTPRKEAVGGAEVMRSSERATPRRVPTISNVHSPATTRESEPVAKTQTTSVAEKDQNEEASSANRVEINEDVFVRPQQPQRLTRATKQTVQTAIASGSDSSISKTISSDVIESFRKLSKRRIDENESQSHRESLKINVPPKKRRVSSASAAAKSYLEIGNKHKKRISRSASVDNRKRTLYSNIDFDYDAEEPPSQRRKSPSPELPREVSPVKLPHQFAKPKAKPRRRPKKNLEKNEVKQRTQYSNADNDDNHHVEKPPVQRSKSPSPEPPREVSPVKLPHQFAKPKAMPRGRQNQKPATKGKSKKQAVTDKDSNSDSDDRSKGKENEDEGFSSDHSNDCRVLYDPKDRGCQRDGLRKRMASTLWWVNNSEAKLYGFTYTHLTLKEEVAEEALKKKMKKDGITHFMDPLGEHYVKPTEKLKIFKNSRAEIKKTLRNKTSLKHSMKPEKIQKAVTKKADTGTSTMSAFESTPTVSSVGSVKSIAQQDSLYSMLVASNANDTAEVNAQVSCSDTYDIGNLEGVQYTECGNGLYFGAFVKEKSDGIIKIIPQGEKKKARTKNSVIKFFVLSGRCVFHIENQEVGMKIGGYLSVKTGCYYSIKNNSDQDVYIQFTRLEVPTAKS